MLLYEGVQYLMSFYSVAAAVQTKARISKTGRGSCFNKAYSPS